MLYLKGRSDDRPFLCLNKFNFRSIIWHTSNNLCGARAWTVFDFVEACICRNSLCSPIDDALLSFFELKEEKLL